MYAEGTSSVNSSCRIFNNQAYDSGGNGLTEYEYAIPNTSTLNTPLAVTKSIDLDIGGNIVRPKLKGNKISYLAPLGRVYNNYYHDLVSYPLNMPNTNPDQYSNITGLATAGFATNPNGLISFVGGAVVQQPPDGQINSPTFPADMPYTGSDTSYGLNNNGWFIPITAGQDCIAITGNLTVSYKFDWSAYTALDALISGENTFLDTTFTIPMRFVPIISNKSAADYAQAQIDDDNLSDVEQRRWLNGTFGSGGTSDVATWETLITDFDLANSPQVRINIDNPPLQNNTEFTLTVPFAVITEPLPLAHTDVQNYLKRWEYSISNFNKTKMFSEAFAGLITSGVISVENFSYQIQDLKTSLIFDGSQISNYFGYEKALFLIITQMLQHRWK